MNKTLNNNQITLDNTSNLMYNTSMTNNNNNNEREIKMTLTQKELDAMVASIESAEVELDEHDMQCALAEYEHYEANWEDIDSDDGHIELYQE